MLSVVFFGDWVTKLYFDKSDKTKMSFSFEEDIFSWANNWWHHFIRSPVTGSFSLRAKSVYCTRLYIWLFLLFFSSDLNYFIVVDLYSRFFTWIDVEYDNSAATQTWPFMRIFRFNLLHLICSDQNSSSKVWTLGYAVTVFEWKPSEDYMYSDSFYFNLLLCHSFYSPNSSFAKHQLRVFMCSIW